MSEDIKHRILNTRNRSVQDLERIIDLLLTQYSSPSTREIPIVVRVETPEKKNSSTPSLRDQVLRMGTELQSIRNQLNKYLKVETKEEAVRCFGQLVSQIAEVNLVRAQYTSDGIIFWILYDKGERIDILEKVVDVECKFERVFSNLPVDYRVVPYSDAFQHIINQGENVYERGG